MPVTCCLAQYYAGSEGEALVPRAKRSLAADHDCWVWAEDRTIGVYTRQEIATHIEQREGFICIPAGDSEGSAAERREVNLALNQRKHI